MKTSHLLKSIVVLEVIFLISADGLSLSLSRPDSSNPSIIRFTCMDGEERAVTATFQKDGEEITDQLSVIINSEGILEFKLSLCQGLGGTFTCTENGVTSNAVTLPGAVLISELSDQTVEGGSTVEFVCEAVASDYQPEIVWMFDSDIYTGCNEGSSYCVESEKFEFVGMTWSKFMIETEEESSIHLVSCYVKQEHKVRDMATLTVETGESTNPDPEDPSEGSKKNEAGIIGGTSVSALVVLVTTTVVTTLVVLLRRYLQRKRKADETDSENETSDHEISPAPEDHEVAVVIDDDYPAGDSLVES